MTFLDSGALILLRVAIFVNGGALGLRLLSTALEAVGIRYELLHLYGVIHLYDDVGLFEHAFIIFITLISYNFHCYLNRRYDRQFQKQAARPHVNCEPPPAIAECVWWLVLPRNRESFQADLEDDFYRWVATMGVKRARRRYRIEVLKVAGPLAIQFARRRFGGALEGLGKRISGKSQVSGD